MVEKAVPVIDFSAFSVDRDLPDPSRVDELVNDVHGALSTIGFMYLKNYGISEQTIENVFHRSKEFFDLPTQTKLKYEKGVDNWIHGYCRMESEKLNPNSIAGDLKESFDFSLSWTNAMFPDEELPEFRPAFMALHRACTLLHNRVLEIMARGLKFEDPYFFVDKHRYIGGPGNPTTMRSVYYPPIDESLSPSSSSLDGTLKTSTGEERIRCGEHSDYGGITLLFQDAPGLQVQDLKGDWSPADPIEGTVVVNLGDFLQQWSSDIYVARKHRVTIPRDPILRQRGRQSIAFFGNPDYDVECSDGSGKYPPMEIGEYLKMKASQTRRNITGSDNTHS